MLLLCYLLQRAFGYGYCVKFGRKPGSRGTRADAILVCSSDVNAVKVSTALENLKEAETSSGAALKEELSDVVRVLEEGSLARCAEIFAVTV